MAYDIYLFAALLNGKSPLDEYSYIGLWDLELGPEEHPCQFKSAEERELEHALLDYLRELRVDLNNRFDESSSWTECKEIPGNYSLNLGTLNIDGNIYDLYASRIPRD